MPFLPFLHRVAAQEHLSAQDARLAMLAILEGEATTAQIAAFLVALKMKGERGDEIAGFARAMREKATPVETGTLDRPLIDTCGTGGDGGGTFNISTAVAFVVAGAGVHVAKHGNRSLSSQCGSADVLEELGVNIAMTPEFSARAIREVGIGFLFAPLIHPAMKHAQPARAELKMRTAFNLLGPLTNPARAPRQLIGAPSPQAAELMTQALLQLGAERAMVVHGSDGLDEITTTATTAIADIGPRGVERYELDSSAFGVERATPEDLRGGDRKTNAAIIRAILSGERGPKRDIVLVNAAAAFVVAGKAQTWKEGVALAAESVDSGRAQSTLVRLAAFG